MAGQKRSMWWRVPAFAVALAAFTLVGAGVWAYWSGAPGTAGSGAAAAISVDQGATPTAISAGSNVNVSWPASTLSSGAAVSGYTIRRYNAITMVVQNITGACSGTVTARNCTETGVPTGQWKYTVTPRFATNWIGQESAPSSLVYTDPTPPTNAITMSAVTGGASMAGTTVYYNGAGAGGFTLTNAVADAGSGPASSSTGALGGTATGWATTASTVSTPTGGPYVSSPFSWTAGTTSSPTEGVTGSDLANNTTTARLTFVNDSTPPTGTLSYTGGYQVGRYVTVTMTGGDSGSGLADAQLQRASARFINGTCGGFGAFTTIATNPTSPFTDNAVVNSWCYQYRYVLTDLVGNTFTATSANTAWVDYAGAVRYETPGLLTQWRLGDNPTTAGTNAPDTLGNNPATYFGNVVQNVSGELPNDSNGAASFNGVNEYVQAAVTTGLPTGAAPRSVELWFTTTGAGQQALFTYGTRDFNRESGLWLNAGGTSVTAWGYGAGNDPVFTLPYPVNDGKWHQIVETYDGTNVDIFIDGVGLAPQASVRITTIDAYGFQIGAIVVPGDVNSGFYFAGSIDEVSVYTRALSATDVLNHYQLGANTGSDSTGPTGGFVSASGLGGTGGVYSTSTTLNLSASPGTDPSGIASTGRLTFVSRAPLTSSGTADGLCGTFGAFALLAIDPPTSTVDTVADNQCYVFEYAVPDTLGNYTTYSSGVIKVDTSAPATPTVVFSGLNASYAAGSILYYRPAGSGSFTVTTPVTDTKSGIASYAFPAFGTGWTVTGTGSTRAYSWTGTATASGVESLVVGNNAGLSSTGSFTLTPDSTNPTGGAISYPNGSQTTHTTLVTFAAGTDTGSGVASTSIWKSTASYSTRRGCGTQSKYSSLVTNPTSPYSDTTTKGCYQYELVVTDRVGNTATYASGSVVTVTK